MSERTKRKQLKEEKIKEKKTTRKWLFLEYVNPEAYVTFITERGKSEILIKTSAERSKKKIF